MIRSFCAEVFALRGQICRAGLAIHICLVRFALWSSLLLDLLRKSPSGAPVTFAGFTGAERLGWLYQHQFHIAPFYQHLIAEGIVVALPQTTHFDNLLSAAKTYLTPDVVHNASVVSGESETATRQAMHSGVASVFAGLTNMASTSGGASTLGNLTREPAYGKVLNNVSASFSSRSGVVSRLTGFQPPDTARAGQSPRTTRRKEGPRIAVWS